MRLHLKMEGDSRLPILAFSNSLGASLHIWDEVVPLLTPHFRILRYDTRGMAQTEVTPGLYTIDQLGQDFLGMLDEQGVEKVHFCGLSMGGLIGQWMGLHAPERIHQLVLSNTAAKIGTENRWNARIRFIQRKGLEAIWEGTQEVWFRENYLQQHKQKLGAIKKMFLQNKVEGYVACCAAIRDADFREKLPYIPLPTLIIAGEEDTATTVKEAIFMKEKIPNSELVVLAARHISCIEQPEAFANTLINFLT